MEVAGVALVAQGQPTLTGQPGHRALDDPPVLTQLLGRLDADAGGDAPVAYPDAQPSLVISFVRMQLPGLRRRGPRRERAAGMAMAKGLSASASLVFTAGTATDSGSPARSDSTRISGTGLASSI